MLRPQRSPFAADSSRRLERSSATRWDSALVTLLPLRTIDRLDTPDVGTRNGVVAAFPPPVAIGDSRTRRALGYVTVNCDTAFTGTLRAAPRGLDAQPVDTGTQAVGGGQPRDEHVAGRGLR